MQALFQYSSVVVIRLGDAVNDATTAAVGAALPVYLDEYDTTGLFNVPGTPVQSISLPTCEWSVWRQGEAQRVCAATS